MTTSSSHPKSGAELLDDLSHDIDAAVAKKTPTPADEAEPVPVSAAANGDQHGVNFRLSLFKRVADNKPQEVTRTWQEFCARLVNPEIRAAKDGQLFSPATFKPKTRAKANVVELSMLVLDCDHGNNLERDLPRWRSLGYAFSAYTTHSHKRVTDSNPAAEERFRVVFPLAAPIPAIYYPALWGWAFYASGEKLDPAPKDASRMFYTPVRAEKNADYCHEVHGGVMLDWRELPAVKYVVSAFEGEVAKLFSAPNGDRNNQLFSSAAALGELAAGAMLDEDRAMKALEDVAIKMGLESREIMPTIQSGLRTGRAKPRQPGVFDGKPRAAQDSDDGEITTLAEVLQRERAGERLKRIAIEPADYTKGGIEQADAELIEGAIKQLCLQLANARNGTKNNTFLHCALILYGLVKGKLANTKRVTNALFDAVAVAGEGDPRFDMQRVQQTARHAFAQAESKTIEDLRRHWDAAKGYVGKQNLEEPAQIPDKSAQTRNTGAWPEPQPLPDRLRPVPELSESVIPEALRGWLADIADRLQVPLDYPASAAVVALSSVVGSQTRIRPKKQDDWTVTPNLWGGVVGRPGTMKTPAIEEALKPVRRLVKQAEEEHAGLHKDFLVEQAKHKATKAARQEQMKTAAKKNQNLDDFVFTDEEPQEPKERRYIINDTTVEKYGELLNENPYGLLLFRDELTGWLRSLDDERRANDRAFFLEAWNGDGSYAYDRIGRGTLKIENTTTSILGGIQPAPLQTYLRAALGFGGDDGLLQRFQVLIYPDEPKDWLLVDRWPDSAARDRAFKTFQSLSKIASKTKAKSDDADPPFLRFDDEAQEFFYAWLTELMTELRSGRIEHPILQSHFTKYRKLVPAIKDVRL